VAHGCDHFEVVVNDLSRVAYVAQLDESGPSAARALLHSWM
jgi:hypothetical protein